MVIGGHGDTTMIPLTRLASYNGIPVSSISIRRIEKVAADTMVGGATLTGSGHQLGMLRS
jgi:malate dehydrogenase